MPKLNDHEIKAKIADGSISAISIDTSIFDRYQCNLGFAVLRKLDQFLDGDIAVLLSEIVISEVEGHIARNAFETERALKNAIAAYKRRWKLSAKQSSDLDASLIQTQPDEISTSQVEDYVAAVGAQVVSAAANVEITRDVLRRYFATEAPFEAGGKKKNEFPDAFALVSLEKWGEKAKALVLCVSADKGWIDFGEKSEHLVVIDDLDTALSFFNDAGRLVADELVALLRAGVVTSVTEPIESALQSRLDDNDFHAEGWSSVEFETEPLAATMQFVEWGELSNPVVVAADEESVTFTSAISLKVGFEANFSFSIRDGIDRDYVSLGSEEAYKEESITFEMALTVSRETKPEPEILEVEIANRFIEIDFGTVEPFQSEHPYHEKY